MEAVNKLTYKILQQICNILHLVAIFIQVRLSSFVKGSITKCRLIIKAKIQIKFG